MAFVRNHDSGQPYLLSLNAMLGAFYATKARALGAPCRFEWISKL